jgi:hypothetical protein
MANHDSLKAATTSEWRLCKDVESVPSIQARQYLSWPFGLILGISQEWAEQDRSALLELVLAGWDAAVACSTQEMHHHLCDAEDGKCRAGIRRRLEVESFCGPVTLK